MGGGLLPRSYRDLVAEPLQGAGHDSPLRGGQLTVEQEPAPIVGVTPLQPARTFVVLGLLRSILGAEVAGSADGARRHALRPPDERILVVELREPRKLHDLVDAQVTTAQRVGGGGEPRESPARTQPSLGFPAGDIELHSRPVRHVARAIGDPCFTRLELRERLE